MKILVQIAPLTAIVAVLTLSSAGCVGTSATDATSAQADDADQAPPWRGGPSGLPSGVVSFGSPPHWESGDDAQDTSGPGQQGDRGGGHGAGSAARGGDDDWQSGDYPSWSGHEQGYGRRSWEYPPPYGLGGGPWQGPAVPAEGGGDRRSPWR